MEAKAFRLCCLEEKCGYKNERYSHDGTTVTVWHQRSSITVIKLKKKWSDFLIISLQIIEFDSSQVKC